MDRSTLSSSSSSASIGGPMSESARRRGKPLGAASRLPDTQNADVAYMVRRYKELNISSRKPRAAPRHLRNQSVRTTETDDDAASSSSAAATTANTLETFGVALQEVFPTIKAAGLVLQYGGLYDYLNGDGDIIIATAHQRVHLAKVNRVHKLNEDTLGATDSVYRAQLVAQRDSILRADSTLMIQADIKQLRRAIAVAARTSTETILKLIANFTKCDLKVWKSTPPAAGTIIVSPDNEVLVKANMLVAQETLHYIMYEQSGQQRYQSLIPSAFANDEEKSYAPAASSSVSGQPRKLPAVAAASNRLRTGQLIHQLQRVGQSSASAKPNSLATTASSTSTAQDSMVNDDSPPPTLTAGFLTEAYAGSLQQRGSVVDGFSIDDDAALDDALVAAEYETTTTIKSSTTDEQPDTSNDRTSSTQHMNKSSCDENAANISIIAANDSTHGAATTVSTSGGDHHGSDIKRASVANNDDNNGGTRAKPVTVSSNGTGEEKKNNSTIAVSSSTLSGASRDDRDVVNTSSENKTRDNNDSVTGEHAASMESKTPDETPLKFKAILATCDGTTPTDALAATNWLAPVPRISGQAQHDAAGNDRQPIQVLPIDLVICWTIICMDNPSCVGAAVCSKEHRVALANAIIAMLMASGKGHWCASLVEVHGEEAVTAELRQYISNPCKRGTPRESTSDLHKDIRRFMRCLIKQTSRSTHEAINGQLCTRIWPMILSGADEDLVAVMKWFLASSGNLKEAATKTANFMVKVALNTEPRAEWKDLESLEPEICAHAQRLMKKMVQLYEEYDWCQFHTVVHVIKYLDLENELDGHEIYGGLYTIVTALAIIESIILTNKVQGVPQRGADAGTSNDNSDSGSNDSVVVRGETVSERVKKRPRTEKKSVTNIDDTNSDAAHEDAVKEEKRSKRARSESNDFVRLAQDYQTVSNSGLVLVDWDEATPSFCPVPSEGEPVPALKIELDRNRYEEHGIEGYIITGLTQSAELSKHFTTPDGLINRFRVAFKKDVGQLTQPLRLHELITQFATCWDRFAATEAAAGCA